MTQRARSGRRAWGASQHYPPRDPDNPPVDPPFAFGLDLAKRLPFASAAGRHGVSQPEGDEQVIPAHRSEAGSALMPTAKSFSFAASSALRSRHSCPRLTGAIRGCRARPMRRNVSSLRSVLRNRLAAFTGAPSCTRLGRLADGRVTPGFDCLTREARLQVGALRAELHSVGSVIESRRSSGSAMRCSLSASLCLRCFKPTTSRRSASRRSKIATAAGFTFTFTR